MEETDPSRNRTPTLDGRRHPTDDRDRHANPARYRVVRGDAVVIMGPPPAGADPRVLCRELGIGPLPSVLVVFDEFDPHRRPAVLVTGPPFKSPAVGDRGDKTARTAPSAAIASTADGRIILDEARRVVERDGRQLDLPRLAFELLAYLMHRPGRVVPRQEILEQVWGFGTGATATITVHVGQLRRRIEDDRSHPVHLRTVRGVGYRFDP